MEHLYTAKVTATGGRNGKVVSEDNVINLDVKMPKALGGPGGEATNPEQLFAAGYAACFDSALNLVARTKRVSVGTTEVTAHVSIGKGTDGGFELAAVLEVKVPGVSKEEAEQLVAAAHQVCPYSKATRGNMDVQLKVVE
ncbi:organic hydroperoxide resistance protein [Ectobacillus sp. JY-23]|uniref:organic hydroperoxide resistance protein n=1 Tax=Ectobacillus sp. JY-23 TaxID=2933872 RepID=UPI001FF61987|nr:organic hydroperoxide resistance protein [Ectobacillus sp. JY-23]UOY91215.1 organic hydroperoxide resistance protein [Ectobacillus sp. JY-23]